MRRAFRFALVFSLGLMAAESATLERLSLDDMIVQSTAIVRGKVSGSYARIYGPGIYTFYTIQVTEQFKGTSQNSITVAVPGGAVNNLRQTFPGAPELKAGDDFVFFLWTGKSGITQIIGLTQGLFRLSDTTGGDALATRQASAEIMLEHGTGRTVKDQTLVMNLTELRSRIAGKLGRGAAQ